MENKSIAEKKKGGRPSRHHPVSDEMLLVLYERYTSRELSEMLDIPAGTLRVWISKVRKECLSGN